MITRYLTHTILIVALSTGFTQAQTTLSDTLSTNQTWTVANSPYQLTDTVVIAQGVTLTIDPGVEVQFDAGVSLIVDGAIVADGADGSEITFTSSANTPAKGDWGTIRFNSTTGVGSVFDHVIVEYGGAPNSEGNTGAMISYRTGAYAFDLTNVTVRNSGGHGIDLRASSPLIQDSEFSNNNGYGVFSDLGLSYEIDNSVFTGNGIGGIRVPINSTPSIQNSTISTNAVGIYIDNGAIPTIKNNTLDGNTVGIVVIEADDYLAFCRLFLDNGQAPDGQQLLSPKTIELMGENHVGDLYGSAGSGFGLGFRVITNLADTKALGSVGQLSWSGAFQTFYFIDREENLAAVLMTQTNPYSSFYGSKMPQFVYQAIVE